MPPGSLLRGLRRFALLVFAAAGLALSAQFQMQDSGTAADLRGIVNVGNGTAWASGTHGTVLRTEDGGFLWQGCAMPPGAEALDLRGVQAFDDQTAVVMSSGKGDLSRVYKTTDGCKSWKLVFTNPDADGFFDAILMSPPWTKHSGIQSPDYGILLGDPVHGEFAIFYTLDAGSRWERMKGRPRALPGEALFAASNQSAAWNEFPYSFGFVTGGVSGSRLLQLSLCHSEEDRCSSRYGPEKTRNYGLQSEWEMGWFARRLRFPVGNSAGAFAVAAPVGNTLNVARIVGGDYTLPDKTTQTANYMPRIFGIHPWRTANTMPHGYRSSVAYDAMAAVWITVGPNGTDVSTDDGKHWRPLLPGKLDDPNADKQWNALSLPYVVGPHGRIGRLRDDALPQGK